MHKQDNINEDGSGALCRTIHPLLRLLLPIYCVFRGRPPWFIMDHGVSRVKKYWHPANFRVRILLDFFIHFMSALEDNNMVPANYRETTAQKMTTNIIWGFGAG